jgi:hypothetical protein
MSLVYEHLNTTAAKSAGSVMLQFHLIPAHQQQNCQAGKWRRTHVIHSINQSTISSVLCLLQRSDDAVWYLARRSAKLCWSRPLPFEAFVWSLPGGAEDNIVVYHSALLAFVSKSELGSLRILSCSATLSTATFRHWTSSRQHHCIGF